MTLVRFHNKPQRTFNNFTDSFYNGFPSLFRAGSFPNTGFSAPVNVKESETGFTLDLVAPGLSKDQFKINLDKGLLTISFEQATDKSENSDKMIRSEYEFKSFKRSFNLDENIDADNISAHYNIGILSLTLPKKAEVKEAAKQISIQ